LNVKYLILLILNSVFNVVDTVCGTTFLIPLLSAPFSITGSLVIGISLLAPFIYSWFISVMDVVTHIVGYRRMLARFNRRQRKDKLDFRRRIHFVSSFVCFNENG
jgi:membrane protein implicated in regulation of membrane protease activity